MATTFSTVIMSSKYTLFRFWKCQIKKQLNLFLWTKF